MTLQKLHIKNFQVHKDLVLDLDPHVTTIVGPSDSGKSALLRALHWLVTNRPAGDAFIHTGQRSAAITLKVDGYEVQREKGPGRNVYAIGDATLEAFGSDVPDEVTKLLNVDATNFQGQHDSPFWFCETAGEVSRQLNQIINLGIIDQTLANLAATLRQANAEQTVVEERLAKAGEERKALLPARQLNEDLKAVEILEEAHSHDLLALRACDALVREATAYKTRSERLLQAVVEGRTTAAKGEIWDKTSHTLADLGKLVQSIQAFESISQQEIPDTQPLEALGDVWQRTSQKRQSLAGLVQEAKELTDHASATRESHKTLVERLKREIGKECPLCGQPIQS